MESTIFTVVFRLYALIISILMAYFCYNIFKKTNGATKGWFFMALGGVSFFLWAVFSVGFKYLDLIYPRTILGSIFLFAIGFCTLIAYSMLRTDFSIDKPKFLTLRNNLILGIVFVFILFAMNFSRLMQYPLNVIVSISHLSCGILLLFCCIPIGYLVHTTKRFPWALSFLFCLIIGTSLVIGQYSNNCCGIHGEKSETVVCAGYDLDYMNIFDLPCYDNLVALGRMYQLFLVLGITIGLASYINFDRALS